MKKVIFQPYGIRGVVKEGLNIVEASNLLGAEVSALCGGQKKCGKCKVRIGDIYNEKFGLKSLRKNVTPWIDEEDKFVSKKERDEGFRLGCCTKILGDLLVYVPEESIVGQQTIRKDARDIYIENDPAVELYHVRLNPPTLEDPLGDYERLCNELKSRFSLKKLTADLSVLRELPQILRQSQWEVTVSIRLEREIIRVRPGKVKELYGMAIDIGTTTIAGYLCDYPKMKVVDIQAIMNPQCKYGEDIMSRINYHMMNDDGLEKMRKDIVDHLNVILKRAITSIRKSNENIVSKKAINQNRMKEGEKNFGSYDIEDMTIVCNTAMHHILLGIDPQYLSLSPFAPALHSNIDIKARDLGININEGSYIHFLPIEAGFVGSDNVGVIIVEKPYMGDEIQLIIDVGTNGEIVLGNKNRLLCASCATGPAFEGAQLSFGMRAAPGGIEKVRIDPETLEVDFKVIGSKKWKNRLLQEDIRSRGICGSGALELLAELYSSGIIMRSGRFNTGLNTNRYRHNPKNNYPEFVVAWSIETCIGIDIVITQRDIQQILLAKAAIYTGCKLMMKRMGITKIDTVKIAGAFGSHINPEKALMIGLFPDCDIAQIHSVGNAAGDGAIAALLDRKKREEAKWVAKNVEHIELTLDEDFHKQFIEAMCLPPLRKKD